MPAPGHRHVLALIAVLAGAWAATPAGAAAPATRIVYAAGKIVPIPASIPHEEGDMVDRRILPDLRWIAARFPIYITDGYSGPLPNGEHVGCNRCHTRHSDHYNGLAVDIVPLEGDPQCDRTWLPITRLAQWAEPVQNQPRPPFRWVGYEGDAGHGCGNHLHLSWNHAPAPEYQLAEWVEVFPGQPGSPVPAPGGPAGSPPSEAPASPTRAPKQKSRGPTGGVSHVQTGGLARLQAGGVSVGRD